MFGDVVLTPDFAHFLESTRSYEYLLGDFRSFLRGNVHRILLIFLRVENYSVETVFASECRALFIVCHARIAHLTLAGNSLTPEKAANFPYWSRSSPASAPSVTRGWNAVNNAPPSSRVFPLTTVLMTEADDLEIAQPDP